MPAGAPRAGPSSPSKGAGLTAIEARRPFGFPRAYRLLSPAEFRRVLKSGRRKTDALFTLVSLPGSGPDARLGIAVSRRVSRSAVERNRIKRVVRDNFRHRRAELPAVDIVVMARPAAAQADYRDITESLERHFDRIERTCAGSQSS